MTESPIDLRTALLEHGPFLRRLARALVRDEADAEDLVQDTYAAALAARPRTDAGLGGWLRTTARNLVHSRGRRRIVRGRNVGVAPDPSDGGESERTVETLEAHALLHRALAELAEPWRTAVRLRFLEGLGVAEIGERTGAPPSTVRSRLQRGLADMRTTLDALAGGGSAGRDRWLAALVPVAGGAATHQAQLGWAVPAAMLVLAGVGSLGWRALARPGAMDAESRRASLVDADESDERLAPGAIEGPREIGPRHGSDPASAGRPGRFSRNTLDADGPPPLDAPHVRVVDPDGRPVPDVPVLFDDDASRRRWRYDGSADLPRTDAWGRLELVTQERDELPHFASVWTPLGYCGSEPVSRERYTSVLTALLRKPKGRKPIAACVELHVPHLRTLRIEVLDFAGAPWSDSVRTWLHAGGESPGDGCPRRSEGPTVDYEHVPTGVPLAVRVDETGIWAPEWFELRALEPTPGVALRRVSPRTRRLVVHGRLVDTAGNPVTGSEPYRIRAYFDPDFPGAENEGRIRIIPEQPGEELIGARIHRLVSSSSSSYPSHEFEVQLPAEISTVDLEVGDIVLTPRPLALEGVTVAPDGRALKYCNCTLWAHDPADGWVRLKDFMSTSEGKLELYLDLTAESRPLAVSLTEPRGFYGDRLDLRRPLRIEKGARDVVVAPEPTREVALRLRRSGNERLRYRTSVWSEASFPRPVPDLVSGGGTLHLPEGDYTATATGPGSRQGQRAFTVPPVLDGGMPLLEVWIDVD